MKRFIKAGLLAGTILVAAVGSVQAQYSSGDLLLGFTTGSAGVPDLVLDLGKLSSLGSGTLNPAGSPGHVGLDAPGLLAQLNSIYGAGWAGLKFGVVGATFQNSSINSTYGTVAHGAAAPSFGAAGTLNSAVATVGSAIGDGSGPTGNSQLYAAGDGFGFSWSEQIGSASSLWSLNATSATYPTTGSLDLYQRINGVQSLAGTLTLGTDGSLGFSPVAVPEPSAYGLLAGFGLLAVALRRRVAARA